MKIYDKAHWQIDGGMNEKEVVAHFEFMYDWLYKHNLLSEYGKEVKTGILNGDAVLTDEMVTALGKRFLDKYYDEYISFNEYGTKEDHKILDDMYFHFKNK